VVRPSMGRIPQAFPCRRVIGGRPIHPARCRRLSASDGCELLMNTSNAKRRPLVLAASAISCPARLPWWEHLLMDADDAEKRIADLVHTVIGQRLFRSVSLSRLTSVTS
jgi:hypothetical protein